MGSRKDKLDKLDIGKKERGLLQAATLGVPAAFMGSYISFLESERVKNQEVLNVKDNELQAAETSLKEAQEMYNLYKGEYDLVKHRQEELDMNYQFAVAFKTNPMSASKEFRFYSQTQVKLTESALSSSTKQRLHSVTQPAGVEKPKKTKSTLRWNEVGASLLNDLGCFMEPKALVKMIQKNNPEYATIVANTQASNFVRAALFPPKKKPQVFVMYQDRVGLKAWMHNDVPKPEYIKGSMGGSVSASEPVGYAQLASH